MKKVLAIFLLLVVCFGACVACNRQPDKKLDLEVEATKDALVEYYYVESYSEKKDFYPKTKVELVKNTEEFIDFVAPLVEYSEIILRASTCLDDEKLFEDYYILKITSYFGKRKSIIGYRNLSVSEDGNCSLILDNIYRYDSLGYNNGKPSYDKFVNYSNDSAEQDQYTVYYDFVLIPKNEIDIELNEQTSIELYTLTYPIASK